MSKRDYRLLLEDITESIDKVFAYTQNMTYNDFVNDIKTQDAVFRNFEIIGEAANQVPEEIKNTYPQIEWHKLISLRNRIIHEYFGVDSNIVWNIIQNNLSDFKASINNILT
jgi:uncharacterized protein with HEPN domain